MKWYRDKATGKNMNRPGWNRLERDLDAGKVSKVVVWRLDRLGRTASGLTALFDKLTSRQIGLVSIRDGLDLGTASGRLMANVLASVAAYENEVRAERIVAALVLLLLESLEDPHRRVALLGRLVLIGHENLVDRGQVISQLLVMLPLAVNMPSADHRR